MYLQRVQLLVRLVQNIGLAFYIKGKRATGARLKFGTCSCLRDHTGDRSPACVGGILPPVQALHPRSSIPFGNRQPHREGRLLGWKVGVRLFVVLRRPPFVYLIVLAVSICSARWPGGSSVRHHWSSAAAAHSTVPVAAGHLITLYL